VSAGFFSGFLKDNEVKSEVEAAAALAGAEAFAAAVAAKLSGSDPGVASKTETFLEKQAQLLETQNRHLEDEHPLRLAHLRNQVRWNSARRRGTQVRPELVGAEGFSRGDGESPGRVGRMTPSA
jgi:hypothetical protein